MAELFDPQTFAMLSLLGGNGGLPDTKSVNVTQDLLFNTLLDPMWGVLTGTFDPYLTVPQYEAQYVPDPSVGMPITTSAAAGSGVMARIANGFLSGNMTYEQAMSELTKAQKDPNSDIFTLDLSREVDRMRDEINSYQAARAEAEANPKLVQQPDNVFTKAGLPTPDRQWTRNDMPMSAFLQQMADALVSANNNLDSKGSMFDAPAPTVRTRSAGRRGSPSAKARRFVPENRGLGDNSVSMMMVDPKWSKAKKQYGYDVQRAARQKAIVDSRAAGELKGLQMTGRTPFKDAVMERLNQLAMLRQLGIM